MSTAGVELLKRSEGFCGKVYKDPAGLETIGYGHRLQKHESFPEGVDRTRAEDILATDLRAAEEAVLSLVKVPLTQGQFDALVDFVFNLGASRLASSTLLRYLNERRYDQAAWQLLSWDHVGEREVAGLKIRREAEFRLWAPALGTVRAVAA